ncbi:hypothetical protein [Dickeya poaceiphila]|uniref:Iron-containing redox enzyme family protein n=1 Tax=Dickeya poaceiphila TaxID=568768 RepID=A0A5B8HG28_9GAMM|nr:hypothetical protein [Dickeya poaceiphila]QDX29065.1 hypothetical protein Dpoa569_0000772 [Dickeya poaceiphila]
MIYLPDYIKIKSHGNTLFFYVFEQVFEITFDDEVQYIAAQQLVNEIENKGCTERDNTPFCEYLLENNLVFEQVDNIVPNNAFGSTGSAFYNRLFNIVNNQWLLEKGETPLAQALLEPEKHRALLLGWTLEYFHVTRLAITSLIGILGHELSPELAVLAHDFVKEELFHERIMAKAFIDTPWDEKQVFASRPLPSTQAYMDFLKDIAFRRPHSFFASLFFYEGDDEDMLMFSELIPDTPEFRRIRDSHLAHARINIQGEHSDFSYLYFSQIPFLTHEQQHEILDDMAYLNFLFYDMQDDVFTFYRDEMAIEERLCINQ